MVSHPLLRVTGLHQTSPESWKATLCSPRSSTGLIWSSNRPTSFRPSVCYPFVRSSCVLSLSLFYTRTHTICLPLSRPLCLSHHCHVTIIFQSAPSFTSSRFASHTRWMSDSSFRIRSAVGHRNISTAYCKSRSISFPDSGSLLLRHRFWSEVRSL